MQTWSFLGATRVLRASAWRGEGGGDDQVGTHGEGVRVGGGRGEESSDEGWYKWMGPCSCPQDCSEVHIPLACPADLSERQKERMYSCSP